MIIKIIMLYRFAQIHYGMFFKSSKKIFINTFRTFV